MNLAWHHCNFRTLVLYPLLVLPHCACKLVAATKQESTKNRIAQNNRLGINIFGILMSPSVLFLKPPCLRVVRRTRFELLSRGSCATHPSACKHKPYFLERLRSRSSRYSKFTSSPATPGGNYSKRSSYVPNWGVGSAPPPTSSPCSPIGAIYSSINAMNVSSVYVCTNSSGWAPINSK